MLDLIYVKKCLGKNRVPIDIYKLRTMVKNSEDKAIGVYDSYGKIISDPRITTVGKFLRKYWVDELPQLANLLKGDISLVGVRPRSESSWSVYPGNLVDRALQDKPGLLGIQYAHPNTLSFNDGIEYMKEYLDKRDIDSVSTNREYLQRIVSNIVLGRVRSS